MKNALGRLALALAVTLTASRARAQYEHGGVTHEDVSNKTGGANATTGSGGSGGSGGGSSAGSGTGAGAGSFANDSATTPTDGGDAATCPTFKGVDDATPITYSRLTSPIMANYFGDGNQQIDPTSFSSMFGTRPLYPSPNGYVPPVWPGYNAPALPWPGWYGTLLHWSLPTNNYMSIAFTVTQAPLDYQPTYQGKPMTLYGRYSFGEDGVRPQASMTISRACGDFGQRGTIVDQCVLNKGYADSAIVWTAKPLNTPGTCALTPGTYYLNIVAADISALPGGGLASSTVPECVKAHAFNKSFPPSACDNIEVANGFGSWSNWAQH